MNASDSTPPSRESSSGESYPQHCLQCQSSWTRLGHLDDEFVDCPECGQPATSVAFFRWWVTDELPNEVTIEVEVPPEISAAVDTLVRAGTQSRATELADVLNISYRFREEE